MNEKEIDWAINVEMHKGSAKFGSFLSTHDMYAIILEEFDELWDSIKKNEHDNLISELIQISALSKRAIIELSENIIK